MAWVSLLAAGIFEIGFAVSMKLMHDPTSIPWSISFYVCVVASFYFLEKATQTIPIGTAYGVWTGIGAVGVAAVGILCFGESAALLRIVFLFMLVASLIGLKVTSVY